jgi:metal-responsive CopG/Arc/MetJ family transcriptional regulator
MPQVKIAISIPQDILKTVDKLSKEKNVSRSAYISTANINKEEL